MFWLSTQACKSFPSLSWRLIGVLCKAERKRIVMVQPKVFLWEPAWIPWWLHFKKPSKLFRSCCNIPIRATTIIHYRLFHSNFPVSSFFLLVVKSFRGNIELHWPPPTPTAKTVLAVREVWLPGLKFLQKTPHKTNQKNNKTKKKQKHYFDPTFLEAVELQRLSRVCQHCLQCQWCSQVV